MNDIEFGGSLLRRGWLSSTPEEFRQAFFPICRMRRYLAGDIIYDAGEEPGGIFGLCRGSVAVSVPSVTSEMHFVHLFQPGTWFGEASILTGLPRRVTTTARTYVALAHAPEASLKRLLATNPEWWRLIGCIAVEMNDFTVSSGDDLMIRDNERRCIATLLRICGCRFEDPEADVALTATVSHEELASMANLSRNTVSDVLHRLAEEGHVELGYRTLSVRDSRTLRAMVDRA